MGIVESGSGDGSETGILTEREANHKSTTSINGSLTHHFRDTEENNI